MASCSASPVHEQTSARPPRPALPMPGSSPTERPVGVEDVLLVLRRRLLVHIAADDSRRFRGKDRVHGGWRSASS